MRRARPGIAAFAIALLAAAGFAVLIFRPATIVPPRDVARPAVIVLIDFGTTPMLVLRPSGGELVGWVYGDWRYYAHREQDLSTGLAALLWPTQGTLGRMAIGPQPPADWERILGMTLDGVYPMTVEQDAVDRLHARLTGEFERESRARVASYGVEFAPHHRRYSAVSNSNRMTAEWLRGLGCEVRGPAFLSRWRVDRRAAARAPED